MIFFAVMFLQAAVVGQPIVDDVAIQVIGVRRVGQNITVDYAMSNKGAESVSIPPTAVVDPVGRSLETSRPTDASVVRPSSSASDVGPGVTVARSVTFEMISDTTSTVSAARFNQSLWYFVIGGRRVPFRF